jgi:hypothetical protein
MTAPDQPRLFTDREAGIRWVRERLTAAGWRPALITDASIAAMLDHWPDPDRALAAWQAIAQGRTYRPGI